MPTLGDRGKKVKRIVITTAAIGVTMLVCCGVGVLIWGPAGFWEWTGVVGKARNGHWVPRKSFWDLLQLLIVPLVLAGVGIWFSRRERTTERTIADDQLQEAALQGYLDRLSDLLLDKDLRASEVDSEVQTLARARTLTLLRGLDGDRKGFVMQFLYDAELISPRANGGRVITLNGADLREARLRGAFLGSANLQGARLGGADLAGAHLANANLMADFPNATLILAHLVEALLGRANLEGADLRCADLRATDTRGMNCKNANLRETVITDRQLQAAESLEGATMPDGRRFHGWERQSYEGKETRRLRELGKLPPWGDTLPGFIVEHTDVFPGWDDPITN